MADKKQQNIVLVILISKNSIANIKLDLFR